MVLQRAWVPAKSAEALDGMERQPVDTAVGQMYSVETGADANYPRGSVIALEPDEPAPSPEDDDNDFIERAVHHDQQERSLRDLVMCASLNNMATLARGKDGWEANGDPTEVALQVFAHKLGLGKPHLTHPPKPAYRLQSRNTQPELQRTFSANSAAGEGAPKAMTRGHWDMLREVRCSLRCRR